MRHAIKAIGVAAGLLTLVPAVQADERFSLRASVGLAEPNGGDFDEEVGYSVGAGWRFLPYLSAEVGYNDFGTFEGRQGLSGGPVRVSGDSLEFGLVGRMSLGDSGFFGQARIGGHDWDMHANDADFEVEDGGTDLYYGAAIGYEFDSRFGIALGFDRYEVGDGDIDRISLGGEFRF